MLLALFGSTSARAEEPRAPAPSAERIRSAADEYDRGRRAFVAGDYEQAAIHFENAFHDSPRPESLRNAIRARRSAHDDAKAATLAEIAASDYADNDTATFAREVLAEVAPGLHEVKLTCEPECGVAADGKAISITDRTVAAFYLAPGPHQVLVSWSGDRTREVKIEAVAGGSQSIALVAPPIHPLASAPAPTSPTETRRPLGVGFFVSGAVLTGAGVAGSVISYLAARTNPGPGTVRRECAGLGESCPAYQRGLRADVRTNVFIAATGGLAIATAVVGIFFTDWGPVRPYVAAPPPAPGTSNAPTGSEVGLVGRF